MTWLRTPPEAKPDAQAAEAAGLDAAAGRRPAWPTTWPRACARGRRRSMTASPEGQPRRGRRPRPAGPWLGVTGWLRWGWRQLTSMRTALVLLFLLAAGSVPGSLLPQEGTNPAAVAQYYSSHPVLARILGGLWLFNVFGAPWFAAIYLLLFTSLVGCVLPRTLRLVGSARQPPPRAPRQSGQAAVRGQLRHAARARGGARVGGGGAVGQAVPAAHRPGLGVRGKGLPARGRQPAVPHRAARLAGVDRPRRAVRLQGRPAAGRPGPRSPTR